MTTAKKETTRKYRMHCKPISYDLFQTWLVRRLRNSVIVNLAIHRLRSQSVPKPSFIESQTHNMAYMILEARTSLLPISRCCISKAVKPSVVVLFVPHNRTKCTNPIRASSGIRLRAMTLSSRNSLSVLMYRPASRTNIMATANPVHHHDVRSVGLSRALSFCAGGLE